MKNKPLISIVTVCLNRVDFIERAVQSVLIQNYEPYEHIIIDGGSNDGTLDLLKKYSHLKVFSDKDNGVYDAMNKGITKAKGDFIGLLNSDDFYSNDCFSHIVEVNRTQAEIDIIVGNANIVHQSIDSELEIIRNIPSKVLQDPLNAATFSVPIPNAWFVKRHVFDKVGFFNQEFSLVADRDFLIRCWINNVNFYIDKMTFYNYLQHEGSLTISTDRIQRLKRIEQSISLSEKYMKADNSVLKTLCERWFIYLASEGIKTSIRLGKIDKICHLFKKLIKQNPRWILKLIKESLSNRRH